MVQTFDKHFYLSITRRDSEILADFSPWPIAQCFVTSTYWCNIAYDHTFISVWLSWQFGHHDHFWSSSWSYWSSQIILRSYWWNIAIRRVSVLHLQEGFHPAALAFLGLGERFSLQNIKLPKIHIRWRNCCANKSEKNPCICLNFLGRGNILQFVDTLEYNQSSLRSRDETLEQQKGYCLALSCVAVGIKGILWRP